MNRQNTEKFQGSENILNGALMMEACHYVFAQTHTMYDSKSES